MKHILSAKHMKESDLSIIENITPSLELMYRAALGIYQNFDYKNKRVCIVCGKGNNAGDGYALATLLKKDNVHVHLLLADLSFSSDGEYYFNKCKELMVPYTLFNNDYSFDGFDLIVDCIFGNGFKGEIKEPYRSMINKINESNCFVISCDINSGLSSDNGMGECVKSNLTMSIGQFKYGHFINSAMDVMDNKINLDIGIPPLYEDVILLEKDDIKPFFEKRKHESNKGSYGYSAIMGGSKHYIGAIKLANLSMSSLYCGSGLSKIIAPDSMKDALMNNIMESTLYPFPSSDGNMIFSKEDIDKAISGLSSLGIGMGLGNSDDNQDILTYILNTYKGNLLIDADGLSVLAKIGLDKLNESDANIVLTPHLKELSRLVNLSIDEIKLNLVGVIKEFVNKYKVTLLVKGSTTIVANKDKMYFIDRGTPGMAKAGSGDVLSGIITGLLSYSNDVTFASAVGAYINGLAGEISANEINEYSMVASDTAKNIAKAISEIIK